MEGRKIRTFGTAPVFFTAISTILGAVMFLRFGFAVGNVGLLGAWAVILLGHMVTIPTAMAIAEIATNHRVEGGGEYFIISRSFGLIIGATIGIALFLSQAISVAFYIIAFSQAFDPVMAWLQSEYGLAILDKRMIAVPSTILLAALILFKGAALGIKALYIVVAILFLSLLMFFVGSGVPQDASLGVEFLTRSIASPQDFFIVFAICFPAFTGMTAGVGLSGELHNPKLSIPLGTMAATVCGMAVYFLITWKLAANATPAMLDGDQLVMSQIALWGPIIPIGLAAATLSSAMGSILVAPRTLQALAHDDILPWKRISAWLSRGRGETLEPVNATLVVSAIALVFAAMGDVDFVARIISMFFMVTYGTICMVSFLEHFASDPAYRPTFRSRWYVSLFGAVMCVWLMFKMDARYATVALVSMLMMYLWIAFNNKDKRGLSLISQGVIFQISRRLQVFVQKADKQEDSGWRPSAVSLSNASFDRLAAFDFLRWLSYRYGFGTYIHFLEGYLSKETYQESRAAQERLVGLVNASHSNVYVDTIVSPSYTSAISQIVQLPGISGKENNMVMLEFDRENPVDLQPIIDNFPLVASTGFDICILGSARRGFGYHQQIHIWLSAADFESAGMMIMLGYILLGHPDWHGASISIFATHSRDKLVEEKEKLQRLVKSGRLPISEHNLQTLALDGSRTRRDLVNEYSADADLVIIGLNAEQLKRQKEMVFSGYEQVGNIMFVHTSSEVEILSEDEKVELEIGLGLEASTQESEPLSDTSA